jgi:hypothetical protein
MKFKVGDKVKIKKGLVIDDEYGHFIYTTRMHKRFIGGEIVTIDEIHQDHYHISEDDHMSGWTDEMLELVPFTKSDLKDGMVVEYRNGDRCVVINGYFMKPTGYGWMPINDYDDELHFKGGLSLDRAYDIVKVYSSKAKNMPDYCDASKLTLIWERKEEHKEMTVEEIEEKLGYKIKVVADK